MNHYLPKRTAYILQIHKNPNQVNMFINQLISDGESDVYIHIDKKHYYNMYDKIIKSPNVRILDECVNVNWGDISQVDATILLIRNVLNSGIEYDNICFRSGQDLLVKNGFNDYLKQNQGQIFMTIESINKSESGLTNIIWPKNTRRLYQRFHPLRIYRSLLLFLFNRGINLFPNLTELPKKWNLFRGSSWFCIPFDIAKYITEFLDKNKWFYNFYRDAMCPDESFFQTLIMNSPYRSKVINNNLTYLSWGKTFWDRNHPTVLTNLDKEVIEESNQYFARKFDESVDMTIIKYFYDKIIDYLKVNESEHKKHG